MSSILYDVQDRYQQLLQKDQTNSSDKERLSLFYILAGNLDLYKKVNYIYDFEDHSIRPDCLDNEEVDFTGSSQSLILLAFNLYNGTKGAEILDTFSSLDHENFELAMDAIRIRFNKESI